MTKIKLKTKDKKLMKNKNVRAWIKSVERCINNNIKKQESEFIELIRRRCKSVSSK